MVPCFKSFYRAPFEAGVTVVLLHDRSHSVATASSDPDFSLADPVRRCPLETPTIAHQVLAEVDQTLTDSRSGPVANRVADHSSFVNSAAPFPVVLVTAGHLLRNASEPAQHRSSAAASGVSIAAKSNKLHVRDLTDGPVDAVMDIAHATYRTIANVPPR